VTDEVERYLYQLQGRIIACERINQALLVALAVRQAQRATEEGKKYDPVGELDRIEKAVIGSMQHATLSTGGDDDDLRIADFVWEAAGQSMRTAFQNVREKLVSREKEKREGRWG
jgi:hypothetical protein